MCSATFAKDEIPQPAELIFLHSFSPIQVSDPVTCGGNSYLGGCPLPSRLVFGAYFRLMGHIALNTGRVLHKRFQVEFRGV